MTPPRTQHELVVVLEERITRIESGMDDIKNILTQMAEQRSASSEALAIFRTDSVAVHSHLDRRVAMLESNQKDFQGEIKEIIKAQDVRVDGLSKRIDALEKLVGPLVWANGILAVVATFFLLSGLGLIWALVTQQASITFP